MAANTNPIWGLTPVSTTGQSVTGANTLMDGTTGAQTAPVTLYTAGTNGGYIRRVRCRALGTNIASVVRLFINNGSASTTATNNSLVADVSLPATTASNLASLQQIDIAMNFAIPNGYKVLATIGTAVAAGWMFTCEAIDF